MKRAGMGAILMNCAGWLAFGQAFGQSPETPRRFEAADVHVSSKAANSNQYARTGPVHAGRYEVKSATMVDLIRIAYGFDADKILGGPNWLEMDRFDVIAKAPADSTVETQKAMLQSLLEERFKLVLDKDIRPLPAYVLSDGKKHQLKESDGSEQTGCKLQTGSGAAFGDGRRLTGNANGSLVNLGADLTVRYACRNMTMAAFAAGLRGMIGAPAAANPILDETGLKGAWNFDIKYSLQRNAPARAGAEEQNPIFDAIDKQLGLTVEEKQIPTRVLVVDKVNRKPNENPPGVAEALPSIPAPTHFEVASVKPADRNAKMSRFIMQPGGRLIADNMSLRFLILRAFNTGNEDQVVGLPSFADTDRYDIIAQAPSAGPSVAPMDDGVVAPMLQALLEARFGMTYHSEERPVTAYSLISAKPKMKKTDASSRTFCKARAVVGAPPGSRVLSCQNITMAQFADTLQYGSPELRWPVADATGMVGGWDFTLTFGPAPTATGDMASASDPTGSYTLIEAIEKQLGLKLEKQKRPMPVIVIDHLEQKPADN